MPTGGLLQLASQGAQDKFLTYNPEVSFFKQVYKTYTNFAIESIRVDFDRNTNIYETEGNKLKVKIPRFGDLLGRSYLVVNIPDIYCNSSLEFKWLEGLGEHIIDQMYITIGGQIIDRQYGEQIYLQNRLELSKEKIEQHNRLVGDTPDMTDPELYNGGIYPYTLLNGASPSIRGRNLYIPLPFWFSKEYGKALPIVSLLYHDIELTIELKPLSQLYKLQYTKNSLVGDYLPDPSEPTHNINNFIVANRLNTDQKGFSLEAFLECQYIFLEQEERDYISKNPQDYLVETHYRQVFGDLLNVGSIEPQVKNLLKNFMFVIKDTSLEPVPSNRIRALKTGAVLFNGLERVETKTSEFFELLQPYETFNNQIDGVYCYSFSLAPLNKRQPAGHINVSRLQNFQFKYEFTDSVKNYQIVFYSEGYNFLRLINGMGALAFAV